MGPILFTFLLRETCALRIGLFGKIKVGCESLMTKYEIYDDDNKEKTRLLGFHQFHEDSCYLLSPPV